LSYSDLTDEHKLEEAINFVAAGQPLPPALIAFLQEANLYDLVIFPKETTCTTTQAEHDSL
jgi:hypothetical protein